MFGFVFYVLMFFITVCGITYVYKVGASSARPNYAGCPSDVEPDSFVEYFFDILRRIKNKLCLLFSLEKTPSPKKSHDIFIDDDDEEEDEPLEEFDDGEDEEEPDEKSYIIIDHRERARLNPIIVHFKEIEELDLSSVPGVETNLSKASPEERLLALAQYGNNTFEQTNNLIFSANVVLTMFNNLEDQFRFLSFNSYVVKSVEALLADFRVERNRINYLVLKAVPDNTTNSSVDSAQDILVRSNYRMKEILSVLKDIYSKSKMLAYKPTIVDKTCRTPSKREITYAVSYPFLKDVINLGELDTLIHDFFQESDNISYIISHAGEVSHLMVPESWVITLTDVTTSFSRTERILRSILNQENLEGSLNYCLPRQPLSQKKVFSKFMKLRKELYRLKDYLDEINQDITDLAIIDSPNFFEKKQDAKKTLKRLKENVNR